MRAKYTLWFRGRLYVFTFLIGEEVDRVVVRVILKVRGVVNFSRWNLKKVPSYLSVHLEKCQRHDDLNFYSHKLHTTATPSARASIPTANSQSPSHPPPCSHCPERTSPADYSDFRRDTSPYSLHFSVPATHYEKHFTSTYFVPLSTFHSLLQGDHITMSTTLELWSTTLEL